MRYILLFFFETKPLTLKPNFEASSDLANTLTVGEDTQRSDLFYLDLDLDSRGQQRGRPDGFMHSTS